jgi:hypothetical protein
MCQQPACPKVAAGPTAGALDGSGRISSSRDGRPSTATKSRRGDAVPMTDRVRPYLFYGATTALCSVCLITVEAKEVIEAGKVWLLKRCPQHGAQRVLRRSCGCSASGCSAPGTATSRPAARARRWRTTGSRPPRPHLPPTPCAQSSAGRPATHGANPAIHSNPTATRAIQPANQDRGLALNTIEPYYC